LKKKKLKKAQQKTKSTKVETHGLTVVETVHTQSLVDVVWQVGVNGVIFFNASMM
jgi:NADH/NAD ratio-sensing transcriptional regulator Rex